MPDSVHIFAVSVVNHLWKAIKKAHRLSEDLIETTKYPGRTEYFPSLELNRPPKEPDPLFARRNSFLPKQPQNVIPRAL